MPDRNEAVICEIIGVLRGSHEQEKQLMNHFKDRLILDAGNVEQVGRYAEQLRLRITEEECAQVLDAIYSRSMVGINFEQVDEVANDLFPDRFIEP